MDPRKAAILKAIVEEYIDTAQPVPSQHVARTRSLGVSSATVRNDMTVLEREGYITQPHTSAGRIPTDKGYRFFVDALGTPDPAVIPQYDEVSSFFARAQRALEDTLHETSLLLSRITDHTAVVIGPQADRAQVRSVQLVALAPRVILAVAVLGNGVVEKVAVDLEREVDATSVATANHVLNDHLGGATLAAPTKGRRSLPPTSGDVDADELVAAVCDSFREHARASGEPMYVGGASRIAAGQPAFGSQESVARLLELLERQYVVVTLVRDLIDAGLTVRIGAENDLTELQECSVVLAPYAIEGERSGTVGVLGPTRMNYPQAMAAVAVVSQRLGRHLSR
jgi:heat-inducible transcriptional repressor